MRKKAMVSHKIDPGKTLNSFEKHSLPEQLNQCIGLQFLRLSLDNPILSSYPWCHIIY